MTKKNIVDLNKTDELDEYGSGVSTVICDELWLHKLVEQQTVVIFSNDPETQDLSKQAYASIFSPLLSVLFTFVQNSFSCRGQETAIMGLKNLAPSWIKVPPT